jgi:hypothetical protein
MLLASMLPFALASFSTLERLALGRTIDAVDADGDRLSPYAVGFVQTGTTATALKPAPKMELRLQAQCDSMPKDGGH